MTDAPENWFAEYMQVQSDLSTARGALAFIRGVLDTCQRFEREITPGLVDAMLKEASAVLDKGKQ
ncbi:hypothetical protein UFOVP1169_34 [uncultured Caudovirales phage]|uniref:Uncharacterized protein n=1 Tax=uncultured Caudovirales phage TaxID=2100421 RepID=A0A6J5QTU7_9CAUD|nr:hypothetical protein UFOVP1169_34 [uncultured Caudovirales phage]